MAKTNGKGNGQDMRPRLRKPHKDQPLPGMEDVRIKAIQECLASLAEVRETLNTTRNEEKTLMQRLLNLMRKHEKQACRSNGVEAVRVPGEEKLRVRTSKEQATAEVDDDDPSDGLDEHEQPTLADA